jgi:ribosomal protein S18 acetylase RimI-like enzyme
VSVEPLQHSIVIRPAAAGDADGLTRTFLESAAHHARLDPKRYFVPQAEPIAALYREGRQHPPDATSITLVAELSGEIVGFVDVRLTHSPDPMHRPITYCHIVEVAVSQAHQHSGIGRKLLQAAEDWGRQQGAEFASLEYLEANTGAAAFYQRLGYGVAALTAIKRL